ncbi:MAG: glycosyltransferase family 9 protein [Vicinamibacteraceae bacterium]
MKILLVRLRLIGDVVFTTPAVTAIRDAFPEAEITYLVEPAAAGIVRGHPGIDVVRVVPHLRGWRRIVADLALARELRRARFDLVVDFHGGPRASFLTWATGAPRRVGYAVKGRSWMYTEVVPRPADLRPRHSVENQWDLLGHLGRPLPAAPDRARHRVRMDESPAAATAVASRLADAGIGPEHRLVVIHVSAGNPFRRWPASHFVELAVQLAANGQDRRIILTSGPSEADAARAIVERARARLAAESGDLIRTGDEYSLVELRSLVARAAVYVGGDSGPLHVAATSDVPIVGLYGPTLPVRSAPWRPAGIPTGAVERLDLACRPCDQRRCVTDDYRCLTGVGPGDVVEAVEQVLAAGTRA